MFVCLLEVYTKIVCFIKTITTLFLLQNLKEISDKIKRYEDNYWSMSRWQLPLQIKTVFSVNFLSFETVLLHKNFKNFLENVKIVHCKEKILKG